MPLIWKLFLTAFTIVVIWFTWDSSLKLYKYFKLNTQTYTAQMTWSVKELSADRFLPYAHYTFAVGNKTFTGEDILEGYPYKNAWAVEQDIKSLSQKPRLIWYSTSNPEYSSLQKTFPIKEFLSTLLLWGLFMYFFGFAYYVMRVTKDKK